jgi:hydrogenase expression/formation protein HypC
MCLAIPGKIVEIQGETAKIDYGGVFRTANLRLCEKAGLGDIALVHAGFVIQILDPAAGEELEKLVHETLKAAGMIL